MNELIKTSDLVSVLSNANIKEMSELAENVSKIISKSMEIEIEMAKPIINLISCAFNPSNILQYAVKYAEDLNKKYNDDTSDFSLNSIWQSAVKNAEDLKKKYNDDTLDFSVNNALQEAFKDVEKLYKEDNNILNCETYTNNYEEITYKTNVNTENIHNDNNICNYREFASDLCFLVKDSIIPEKLLFILNKHKNNKTFLIILIVLFFAFNIAKDKVYDIVKNALKNLIVVKSSEDIKTRIINQTINNITIINDNKPYYYYIETKDKNGNIINGYVSKRKYNQLKSNKTVQK